MARQIKPGIDYFPMDCQFDNRFKLLEAECGVISVGVMLKLFQRIYGIEGYYVPWDEDSAFLFADEIHISPAELNKMITVALKRGIFDRLSYEKHSILTSKDIQHRYLEATSRRKNVELNEEYALIMYTSCQHNDNKSTQSKVKESKVKETKVKESKEEQGECDAPEREEHADPKYEKKAYGEFNNVLLSDEEYELIKSNLPSWQACIEHLSEYMFASGKSYKSHFNTIMLWAKQDEEKKKQQRPPNIQKQSEASFDEDEFFRAALKRSYGDDYELIMGTTRIG